MVRKKSRKRSEFRNQIDDSLSDLLNDDGLLDDIVDGGNLPKVYAPEQHDYKQIKDAATEKARKTIMSLMKFYLSEDIISNEEYIVAKKNIDVMTLSSLIFQLEAGEKALVTLLNTINSGELSPRMFEVLATLQKSMLDIIKSQTMYLMAAEESTKKISRDLEVYKGLKRNILPQSSDGGPSNINMGTKSLMQSIQEEIKNEMQIENKSNTDTDDNTVSDDFSDVSETEIIDDDIIDDELENMMNEDDEV